MAIGSGPFVGDVLGWLNLVVWVALAMVLVTWVIVFRTAWGLRLRSAGENPLAAETAGLSVVRTRYLAGMCSGALAAPGGANVVVELHRCLLYPNGPFQLPEANVWEAASLVDIGGHPGWVPPPQRPLMTPLLSFPTRPTPPLRLGRGFARYCDMANTVADAR